MITLYQNKGKLVCSFKFEGTLIEESLGLEDTPANRRKLQPILEQMEAELLLGSFRLERYFPKRACAQISSENSANKTPSPQAPDLEAFAADWFSEKSVEWSDTYKKTTEISLNRYILPLMGSRPVSAIKKQDILNFRRDLTKAPGRGGNPLSSKRINQILVPLKMILTEASERFEFQMVWRGIKRLREEKAHIDPFTLKEMNQILTSIRRDFYAYFSLRFLTALRSSEADGLQWGDLDLDRHVLHVRRALVAGKLVATKNAYSNRTISLCSKAVKLLEDHRPAASDRGDFVFTKPDGGALENNWVNRHVWRPLLRHLNMPYRPPYQTRHTTATLWLAAGENPEWIARQMGHANTEMLFDVYSRFVPNLTGKDGARFEALIENQTAEGVGLC